MRRRAKCFDYSTLPSFGQQAMRNKRARNSAGDRTVEHEAAGGGFFPSGLRLLKAL